MEKYSFDDTFEDKTLGRYVDRAKESIRQGKTWHYTEGQVIIVENYEELLSLLKVDMPILIVNKKGLNHSVQCIVDKTNKKTFDFTVTCNDAFDAKELKRKKGEESSRFYLRDMGEYFFMAFENDQINLVWMEA